MHQQLAQRLVVLAVGLDDELRAGQRVLVGDQCESLQRRHARVAHIEKHRAVGLAAEHLRPSRTGSRDEGLDRGVLQPQAVQREFDGRSVGNLCPHRRCEAHPGDSETGQERTRQAAPGTIGER
ncbi:MAG: hypothetical protein B7Y51_05005 [Burkholderiales bacterium 28-67-8]|nr:MAG: hypothetical protein B7Y51_05005 [Burkholderiales bacterium 28-67-8]